MIARFQYLILIILTGLSTGTFAQGMAVSDTVRIPTDWKPEFRRQINHDGINREQRAVMASDGKADLDFTPSPNDEINFLLTYTLVKKVDRLQYLIETNKQYDHRLKVNYLKGLENLLKYYRLNWRAKTDKKINAAELPGILNAYQEALNADKKNESIEHLVEGLTYDGGVVLMESDIFEKNPGYKAARNIIIRKYCVKYPDKIFYTLKENPDVPFADSLIRAIAKKYPRQLYDYAAAWNKLGILIRSINDDVFIRSVTKMANSRSGQQYFPFLDNIVSGKMTIEEIDAIKDDSIKYYKLLVKTQMDYVGRALNKDTAFEFKSLTKKLETRAREVFVNTINALHNESDAVRFRIIQPLTAEELYYLAVSTDGLIYTSSFVKGVYPLMMKKIDNRGDSLLKSLQFDKYRKFIKMSAGYNTLSNFLASFPNTADANLLMRAFVSNLERSDGLEDGVDVADSYASIAETLKPIANEMLVNTQVNYRRNLSQNNKRGMAIYNILNKLFLSADSTKKIDLTRELGIPPVYEVPFKSMANDSGRTIMQVFFYGDKDGQGIFKGFVGMFSNANWKISSTDKWVAISSAKGKPVTIFANKPLPEEGGEDEKAQKELGEFLQKNKLFPTITIHRGHSYYAPYTIEQMFPTSKIVFLGSCGGYHLIHDVLEKAPDAHIIASKQIGKTAINKPFFQLLTEKVRNGNNVEWIPFWKQFEQMANVEGFEDYIPPYENLGALFIKAYTKAMGEDEVHLSF